LAISRTKRWFFIGVIGVLYLVAAEVVAFVALWARHGHPMLYGDMAAMRETVIAESEPGVTLPGRRGGRTVRYEKLHPYAGFVLEASSQPTAAKERWNELDVSPYGFVGTPELFEPESEDAFVIAVCGGSVAFLFSFEGVDAMVEELRALPEVGDRPIHVVRLALGGYKQPQPYLALAWLATLGARYDLVVSIDGFNEVALPLAENHPAGVATSFPRAWDRRVSPLPSAEVVRLIGDAVVLRRKRRNAAQRGDRFPANCSFLAGLLFEIRDARKERRIVDRERKIRDRTTTDPASVASGPFREPASEDEAFDRCVDIWAEASRQMHGFCRANGAAYAHVLQPNQYVEGSKPMGAAERRIALGERTIYRDPATKGYPLLIRRGEALRASGLPFFDATGVFGDVEEPVYVDDCCHFNERGNEILGRWIGRRVVESWERVRAPRR